MEHEERRSGQGRRGDDQWHRDHTLNIEDKLDRTNKIVKLLVGLLTCAAAAMGGLVLYLNTRYEPAGSVAKVSAEQTTIYQALNKAQTEAKASWDALAWKVDSLMQAKSGDAATIAKLQDTLSTLNVTLAGLKSQLDQTGKNADRIEDHERRIGRLEAKAGITP